MTKETIYTGFTPLSKKLGVSNKFSNVGEWILISTSFRSSCSKHVCNQSSMSNFLVRHKLKKILFRFSQSNRFKFITSKVLQRKSEKIKLNVLLVQSK